MRLGGGDGVGDTISEDASDFDAGSIDEWESVSDDVVDTYPDISSDIRESMGVGEVVSEDVADADSKIMGVGEAVSEDIADAVIETTVLLTLGRGGSRLIDTEAVGAGEAVTENIAGVDIETMRLCWLIC
jgi:hypothetical protein